MSRRRTILIASLFAVLAVATPLGSVAVFYEIDTSRWEEQYLEEYATWTLQRARRNFDEAKQAIATLEAEDAHACSSAHIERMRQLTLQTGSVEEIGFFQDGQLRCTSWGAVSKHLRIGEPDAWLDKDFGLEIGMKPKLTGGEPMNALNSKHYNVLMNPSRLVDVLTNMPMILGVSTMDGRLVASSGPISSELLRRVTSRSGSGSIGPLTYYSVDNGSVRSFAIADFDKSGHAGRKGLWGLIPIGIISSILLVSLVIWVSRQQLSLEKQMSVAIARREFVVFYQPIIEIATGRCVGAEALLRWKGPDGAWVSPELFIPLAEEGDLIESLTDLMIECVVRDFAKVLNKEPSLHVAINISASDMQTGRFLEFLSEKLTGSGVSASQIWLEATERGFMDAEAARETMYRAKAAGHLVAIDDFGTGYSSLSHLETLPLDALKIDKSFVDTVGTQAAMSGVISHIIAIGHGQNLLMVAEGVETEEQARYLHKEGVQFAQGWFYSKALSVVEFLSFVAATNRNLSGPEIPYALQARRA